MICLSLIRKIIIILFSYNDSRIIFIPKKNHFYSVRNEPSLTGDVVHDGEVAAGIATGTQVCLGKV
jgi:hypothetical protein